MSIYDYGGHKVTDRISYWVTHKLFLMPVQKWLQRLIFLKWSAFLNILNWSKTTVKSLLSINSMPFLQSQHINIGRFTTGSTTCVLCQSKFIFSTSVYYFSPKRLCRCKIVRFTKHCKGNYVFAYSGKEMFYNFIVNPTSPSQVSKAYWWALAGYRSIMSLFRSQNRP